MDDLVCADTQSLTLGQQITGDLLSWNDPAEETLSSMAQEETRNVEEVSVRRRREPRPDRASITSRLSFQCRANQSYRCPHLPRDKAVLRLPYLLSTKPGPGNKSS